MSTPSPVQAYTTSGASGTRALLAPIVIGFVVAMAVLALGDLSIFHCLRGDAAQFDAAVRASVHAEASPPLTQVCEGINFLGKWPLPAIAVVLFIALWRRRRKNLAWFPPAAFVAATVLLEATKYIVQRVRPHAWFGLQAPASWSYPSGHTLDSTTCYLVFAVALLVLVRSRLSRGFFVFVCIALPLMVGFVRVYLGEHWPTDVLVSWAAGLCLASGFIASHRRAAKNRNTLP